MEQSEIAYAAGLFDGEGCVMVNHDTSRPSPRLQIEIAGSYLPMFDWLVENFGGNYYVGERPLGVGEAGRYGTVRTRHKQGYKWSLTGRKAVEFLTVVLPFLMEKREQAVAVLNPECEWGSSGHISDNARALRFQIRTELKELKH